jgi:HEAT repeat protein
MYFYYSCHAHLSRKLYNFQAIATRLFLVEISGDTLYSARENMMNDDYNIDLLQEENPLLRGEAATILGIIGSPAALQYLLPLKDDPDPGVREIITDILTQRTEKPGCPTANEEPS